jgi:LysM repeat protein
MLQLEIPKYYKVKKGQTIEEIAQAFQVSAYLLVKENGLKSQPFAGQMLKIPAYRGNVYTARAGDSKALLCGSEDRYEKVNGTDILYIGMRVIL